MARVSGVKPSQITPWLWDSGQLEYPHVQWYPTYHRQWCPFLITLQESKGSNKGPVFPSPSLFRPLMTSPFTDVCTVPANRFLCPQKQ